MSDIPIGQHAFLSDCGAAALVTSGGSVDWLCLPRFDSPSVLARLLDDEAGHFLVAPSSGGVASRRRYLPSTLVLESTYDMPAGCLVTTDALALGRDERGHELGKSAPGVLLRVARCTRGEVEVQVEFAPRPEFGLVHSRLTAVPGGVIGRGGGTVLVLSCGTDIGLALDAATASGTVTLREGEELTFALEQASAWDETPAPWSAAETVRRMESTEGSWRSWAELHQRYEGPHHDLVHHSGVVLQGLTRARSGAIVAAPTTSLPEGVGSSRTWDYRFTWIRDASLTMQALWVAACPDEAEQFFSFLATAASTQLERGDELQIMFGIGAERDLSERELSHLSGWRGSAPVRVGNDAWSQRQLDVYGALLDSAYTLREQLGEMDDETRRFLVAAVDAAVARWDQTDQGIWEMRGAARHYVHSKLMCWVAVDRGLAMADALRVDADKRAAWSQARDDVRAAIEERGWSERAGAFTQRFGSDDLDASVLLLALVGFLPPDDSRLRSTIDAIAEGLADERGLIYRYRSDDGLEGQEGTFLLCTFWLAHALAVTGQLERARDVLDRAAGCATDLGLFAEQVDAESGEPLGNFPQAFSHIGLILASHAVAEAERAAAG